MNIFKPTTYLIFFIDNQLLYFYQEGSKLISSLDINQYESQDSTIRVLRGPQMNYFMQKRQYVVIAGCLLLSFIMGSIHAFSLLLEPIETKFFVSRSFSSFTYSLSLISITTAVYFGSYIYKRLSPTSIVLIVMTVLRSNRHKLRFEFFVKII